MAYHRPFSQCTATAATSGASFGNNAGVGTLAWSSVANAVAPDNNNASASQSVSLFNPVQTEYITAKNFGFAIPSNAIICGIVAEVEHIAGGLTVFSSITDNSVRIIKNGAITGTDQSAGAAWPGSAAYASYGGAANQWGVAWTPADINAAGFGVAVSASLNPGLAAVALTAGIDHIRITVYYDFLLPASALYFKTAAQANGLQLIWAAAGTQAGYYIVEKSPDARSWYRLDSIAAGESHAGAGGYQSFDPAPAAINYYRLKHADNNSNITIDYTIAAKYDRPFAKTRVYMDAASHRAVIECEEGIKSLGLFDINLRPLGSTAYSNGTTAAIDVAGLPRGLYIARGVTQSNKVFTARLVLP